MTTLLISPKDLEEVGVTLKGEPNIIDIKNPLEGSLGANFPHIIKEAREKISLYNKNYSKNIKLSVAIGDFPDLPGSASLAALGAASIGANYVKIGLKGTNNIKNAIYLAKSVVKAVKDYNSEINVVIAGYADQHLLNYSIDPLLIPEIAGISGADVAMIDTAIKDGKSLIDHLSIKKIKLFLNNTKKYKVKSALAGSLKFEDLDILKDFKPDIIGVRSIVCENFDRMKGKIKPELIIQVKNVFIS